MSVKRILPLPALAGVVAGQVATCDIPKGPRYHMVTFRIASSAKLLFNEIVDEIKVKINGKAQRTFTAAQLDALNREQGTDGDYAVQVWNDDSPSVLDPDATTTNVIETYLTIFFAEPWRKQVAAADGLAWGTGNVGTFQIEFKIKAGVADPVIDGFAEVDTSIVTVQGGANVQAPLGVISKWYSTQIPINGTLQTIQSFPKNDAYQQISFFDEDITKVIVQVESFTIREYTKPQNDASLRRRGMVPVPERFDIVFDHDDILNSALPMVANGRQVSDFQIKLELSDGTARNIPCIFQTIGPAD